MSVRNRLLLVLMVSFLGFALLLGVDRLANYRIAHTDKLKSLAEDAYVETLLGRSQEQRFFLLKTEDHIANVLQYMDNVQSRIESIAKLDPESQDVCGETLQLLETYRQRFNEITAAEKAMGLTWDQGLQGMVAKAGREMDNVFNAVNDKDMSIILLRLRGYEKDYLSRGDQQSLGVVRSQLALLRRSIDESSLPPDKAGLLEDSVNSYLGAFEGMVGKRNMLVSTKQAMDEAATAMEPSITRLKEYYDAKSQHIASTSTMTTVATEVIAGLALIMLTLWSLLAVTRPLKALQQYSKAISSGNLSAEPHGVYGAEFLSLSHDLKGMVEELKNRLEDVRKKSEEASMQAKRAEESMLQANDQEAKVKRLWNRVVELAHKADEFSDQLATAAEQLTGMLAQIKRGAFTQSERMAETATAMEQMNSAVVEVARNAADASSNAQDVQSKARSGADMVYQAMESIAGMRDKATQMQAGMTTLGGQVGGIGQVMTVINEIADQTNLLALNAAIEAARAGDAGRGFAVVADEVRKLAEKTMQATKEVDGRIKSIQVSAQKSMEYMREAVDAVERSAELAKASGSSQEEIMGLVESNSRQVEAIASASEEQSTTSEEISRAVEEVNRIAEESAQGIATSHKAVESLSDMAVSLREMMQEMLAMEDGDTAAGNSQMGTSVRS
ncbi:MAG: methyl-accepting chemotaxis protein [Desulfocurvibacter africanus]